MTYHPAPLPTERMDLPQDLLPLLEGLAAHAHDVWAQTRLDQGWCWGPERNDPFRQHPCLVPYDELPESEKEVDRRMAREVLKGLHLLGYEIIPAR